MKPKGFLAVLGAEIFNPIEQKQSNPAIPNTSESAHEQFDSEIESIPDLALAEMAQSALTKLCSTGGRSFQMTIPPRIDDTDIVFSELIRRFKLRWAQLNHLENIISHIEQKSKEGLRVINANAGTQNK